MGDTKATRWMSGQLTDYAVVALNLAKVDQEAKKLAENNKMLIDVNYKLAVLSSDFKEVLQNLAEINRVAK